MIAVIADDLSGAAELAGAARNRGLDAELQTVFHPETAAAVVCLDMDTRGQPADVASLRAGEAIRRVAACRPEWIYKKCDSVLRGNVLVELQAMMEAAGFPRAMLIATNPSRGRVIRDGRYFVGDRPLHQTSFAHDPEHPCWTAEVVELLAGRGRDTSSGRAAVCWLRIREELPPRGVLVPDAVSPEDLAFRAAQVDDGTLPAGAVEFFDALLRVRRAGRELAGVRAIGIAAETSDSVTAKDALRGVSQAESSSGKTLFVCGSAAAWSDERPRQCALRGFPVVPMPAALFAAHCDQAILERWIDSICRALDGSCCVMAGIGDQGRPQASPSELVVRLAGAVRQVLQRRPVARLCVEGGATAAALLRELGWTRWNVCQPCAPGVGALRPLGCAGPVLFVKPGTYAWPSEIWTFARLGQDPAAQETTQLSRGGDDNTK